jgi:hypothetical protein
MLLIPAPPPHNHTYPISWGGRYPSTWATMHSNIKQLGDHMCSSGTHLGQFWHKTDPNYRACAPILLIFGVNVST